MFTSRTPERFDFLKEHEALKEVNFYEPAAFPVSEYQTFVLNAIDSFNKNAKRIQFMMGDEDE